MDHDLVTTIGAALAAGEAILEVYESEFAVEHKDDRSPLTLADRRAHEIIVAALAPTNLPVLSEEGRSIPHAERSAWETFWLVDPLDGTKEFIKRNGEFTVNIARIHDAHTTMGVIYVPVADTLYFGTRTGGAYKVEHARQSWQNDRLAEMPPEEALTRLMDQSVKLPRTDAPPRPYTIVGSRSHSTPEVERIVEENRRIHGTVDFISAGSSLKICMVAEGRADLYPRTGPTMEWDTGAGQAIAQAAGAEVVEFDSDKPLRYNKEDLLNPWFTVRWP